MAGVVGQVSFFVALLVVIVIHEAAHFGVAKWFGIKVEEFFVGFGPRIWSFRRGETEYGLKAIPAGGYVKIAGMNPFQETPAHELPRSFGAKPIWQRALVIVAGPATHFVLAFLCFAIWLAAIGDPRIPLIEEVEPTLNGSASPAAAAELRPGDLVVGVGPIEDPTDEELIRFTRDHVGEPISLSIEREGEVFTVRITPVLADVDGERVGRIGVALSLARDRAGPIGAVTGGAKLVGSAAVGTIENLGRVFGPEGIGRVFTLLFTDAERTPRDPASVVGIGRFAGQTAEAGNFGDFLYLFALVNVFIGLLNLLPLPPFDGGHLAVLAIEKVRGRKVDMRKLVPISAVVAMFFILFTLSVVYLDIAKPIDLP
ncbi:MAG: M50 family metallopeptidase [Actinomycetota bacterium]